MDTEVIVEDMRVQLREQELKKIFSRETKLLREWLSPQEHTELLNTGYIHVKGSAGGEYRLGLGQFYRRRKGLFWRDLGMKKECVQLLHCTLVDRLVGLKIMLENDEPGVRNSADQW